MANMGEPKKQCTTTLMKQCFVTAGVSINMAGSGFVMGFTAPLLQQLRSTDSIVPIDESSASWIAAIPGIALIFGSFLVLPCMSRYGRKWANLFSIVPLIVGWSLIYFAKSVTVLVLARLVQGVSMGMCTTLGSVLIGEYTSPKYRGAFLMTMSISIAFSVLFVHLSGSYLSWQNTALICGIVAVVDLLIVLFSPESPSWLASKGRYEACKKSFRWLRGDAEEDELKKMIEASMVLKETKDSLVKPKSFGRKLRNKLAYFNLTIRKKEFYKPIIIMMHFYLLGQWCGINMLVAFPADLFHKMLGNDSNVPLLLLTLNIHRIIANTTALYVIQKIKRRTILKATVLINIFGLVSCAIYSYAKLHNYISSSEYIIGFSLIHIHVFSVATGSMPLSFIIGGEVFPLEYRGLSGGITVLFYSMNVFVVMKTLPRLLSLVDLFGTYILYSLILIYSLCVVWYMLPETKDRTLQDIEDEFRGRPLSPEEMKSMQSLASWKNASNERRCSGAGVL